MSGIDRDRFKVKVLVGKTTHFFPQTALMNEKFNRGIAANERT
jgi:hypothetical protein